MGSSSTSFCLGMSRPYWAFRPSEISLLVTAPNSLPPLPALALIFTGQFSSFPAISWASAFSRASSAFRAFSFRFMVLMASAVAGTASFRGRRKFRP